MSPYNKVSKITIATATANVTMASGTCPVTSNANDALKNGAAALAPIIDPTALPICPPTLSNVLISAASLAPTRFPTAVTPIDPISKALRPLNKLSVPRMASGIFEMIFPIILPPALARTSPPNPPTPSASTNSAAKYDETAPTPVFNKLDPRRSKNVSIPRLAASPMRSVPSTS